MTMTALGANVQKRALAARPEPAVHTLAAEHATLLRDVRRRATPILALAEARTWPTAELDTLIGFLRAAMLRQVSDEEHLLFPGDHAAAPFAELSTDHLRLRTLTRQLEQASVAPVSLRCLTALIEELLNTLERHMDDERAVLSALPGGPREVPGTAELANGSVTGMRPTEDTVIVLDRLPIEQAVQLSIERLLRLRPGESAEVRSSSACALRRIWDWMRCYDTVGYGFSRVQRGRQQWGILITRRATG